MYQMAVDRPAGSHYHNLDQLSDAGVVGKELLRAETQEEAQTAAGIAPGGGASWGDIAGTLSAQTDLQTALDAKSASTHNHDASYEPANANIQAHVAAAHAPANAQKNSDITKAEIEAKLTGEIASHSHAGAGVSMADVIDTLYPVGGLYISTLSTNPATLLGRGTWTAFGAGRIMIGHNAGDVDFDTAEETGGSKTSSALIAHTHVQDPHTHTQNSHNHTQDAHSHVITSQTATTGGATSYEHGTLDTSSTEAEATETTATSVATNQAATAVNQNATAVNQSAGSGASFSIMNPYIVVYFWKRTA